MRLVLIKVNTKKDDRYKGTMHYCIFQGIDDRKKYKAMVRDSFGNYKWWAPVLKSGPGTVIYNVQTFGQTINCDSVPTIMPKQEKIEEVKI